MNTFMQLNDLKFKILHKKAHGFCDTCLWESYIPDPDDEWVCPSCHGDGIIFYEGFDRRSTLARELWALVWRAARKHKNRIHPALEAFDLMTDSMLISHMLDFTPYQLFELIKTSRQLLSDRDTAPQLNMMQYKLACRNGEISFDEELPF